MARYLVVAHRTLDSLELRLTLRRLAAGDPAAEFDLLVPAAPAGTYVSEAAEDVSVARRRALTAAFALGAAGFQVRHALAGAPDVVDAIRDRLAEAPGYAAIVMSTLPPGISGWLHVDAVSRAHRIFGGRLIHVIARHSVAGADGNRTHQRPLSRAAQSF